MEPFGDTVSTLIGHIYGDGCMNIALDPWTIDGWTEEVVSLVEPRTKLVILKALNLKLENDRLVEEHEPNLL